MFGRRSSRHATEHSANGDVVITCRTDLPGQAITVITCRGDMQPAAAVNFLHQQCSRAIREAVREVRGGDILIDLTRAQTADSKLVAAILLIVSTADRHGIAVNIHASPSVLQWFETCRVRELLTPHLTPNFTAA